MKGRLRPAPLLLGAAGLVLLSGVGGLALMRSHALPPVLPPDHPGPLPRSEIILTVTYSPLALLSELEGAIARRTGDLSTVLVHPVDPALRYAIQADRGPFDVQILDGEVRLSTDIAYAGQVWYSAPFGIQLTAGCGTGAGAPGTPGGPPRARMVLGVPLEVASGWKIASRSRLHSVAPVGEGDRCIVNVLGVETDVTDPLMEEASEWLAEFLGDIDSAIGLLDPVAFLEPWWEALQDPIRVDEGLWLLLNPEEVGVGPLGATGPLGIPGAKILMELTITVQPSIVVGPPPPPSRLPLPDPRDRAGSSARGIHVEGSISFAELARLVLAAVTEAAPEWAGRPVEVTALEFSGDGKGTLHADVEVEGPLRGKIRLTGTPMLDPNSGEVVVPDLELSVLRGGAVLRSAALLARLGFVQQLRSLVRIPMEDPVAHALVLAEGGMNATFPGEARLAGSMQSLEVTHLRAERGALVIRARIEATTHLTIGAD